MLFANSCLSCAEACDRHAEGRAGDIIKADIVAELDRARVAAVLTADTAVELRVDGLAERNGHLHELADAVLIKLCERIVLKDLGVIVSVEELACIVTAEAEGHLSQVVGTEAEEISLSSDLVGGESRSRDLDHGADLILEINTGSLYLSVGNLDNDLLDELELLDVADKRDHDLGNDLPIGMLLLNIDSSADNGSGLHLCDFGIGDGQAAAAVTHHRVELMERSDDSLDILNGLVLRSRKSLDVSLLGGNKLMERRIKEADGYRLALKGLIELLEVALLIGRIFSRASSLSSTVSEQIISRKAAILSASKTYALYGKADALCAELNSLGCVARSICMVRP